MGIVHESEDFNAGWIYLESAIGIDGPLELLDGDYIYYEKQAKGHYVITESEIEILGEMISEGLDDPYSEWCSCTGREATDEEIGWFTR